ncbi:MAG: hypothetical protein K5985_10170 [Lachnospiraceae bacterium]|nr:hypothetical protein [Lachnospiraceae bacterium]
MGNHWLNRMERKFGRFAIRGLTRYIIITYIAGYILYFLKATQFIGLDPYLVFHGQIWRVVTWVLMPPESPGIFTIIMLLLYYQLGNTLEQTWGEFRYNLYIFSGLLFTLIGTFIIYILGASLQLPGAENAEIWGMMLSMLVSTYYVNMSIFLAFAASYPNMQLLLYFIIPVKVKYFGFLYGAILLYNIWISPWFGKIIILISLLNFGLFFLGTRNLKRISPGEIHRKNAFKKSVDTGRRGKTHYGASGTVTKHKCAICGRTELDGPELEFRFCSKCNGNYEYCQEHLFTHMHIK